MKSNKEALFAEISDVALAHRKKMAQPDFVQPMLATLTDEYLSKDTWIYEEKFDGERCIAIKKNGKVHLVSRNQKLMNEQYPTLVQAFENQAADNFIVDGEIVAWNANGVSDFQMLQGRINLTKIAKIKVRSAQVSVALCIFDVMYAGGYDVRNMPLLARKQVLQNLLLFNKTLIYTKHKVDDGIAFFKHACRMHWEGVIAKRADSTYVGVRSPNWLKFKCIMKQELIIVGYTEPKGSRQYFGALLVGYYKDKKLMYAGKVGTGYSEQILEILGKRLQKLEIKKCPLVNYDESTKGVHWVKPQLVAEFQFAEWTSGGKLRVGRDKGLRDDKDAKDVVRERPKAIGPR
jgi:bifunctional non-homologous end joining protein LigD